MMIGHKILMVVLGAIIGWVLFAICYFVILKLKGDI